MYPYERELFVMLTEEHNKKQEGGSGASMEDIWNYEQKLKEQEMNG